MKKEAFLRALDKRLEGMSAEERARALEFALRASTTAWRTAWTRKTR